MMYAVVSGNRGGRKADMTIKSNRAEKTSAAVPSRNPNARPTNARKQPDLGWREFFERLGDGTLPGDAAQRDRKARDPIRSFSGYMTGSDSR